jgi:hypothetical protein
LKRDKQETGRRTVYLVPVGIHNSTVHLSFFVSPSHHSHTTMSGRLIILPKKSYCPWKPENVERVLRDERREAERLEREKEIATRHESELRLTLRRKQQGLPDIPEQQPQHVNLFQAEEEASLQKVLRGNDENNKVVVGVMPVSLGQTVLKTRGDRRPFYLRESEQVEELSTKETKRQDTLDPMRKFSKRRREKTEPEKNATQEHEDRRRHRKHQKKSKKESKRKPSKASSSKGQNDLQELRRRRQEREAHESIRASELFGREQPIDDRKRPYHNQFNPGLSRR